MAGSGGCGNPAPAPLARSALIVDPDEATRRTLQVHLELAGFVVHECANGRDGLQRLDAVYDVVIFDLDLPGMDGLTFCRAVRGSASADTALLILTARDTESDKVVALSSGADDYVTKPFGARELLARTDAIRRRIARWRRATDAGSVPPDPALCLHVERRQALVRGRAVSLTRQEFDLLYQLIARPGTVVSRVALLERVWSGPESANERTVDVAISRLRRKIELDPRDPQLIVTTWGSGYKVSDGRLLRSEPRALPTAS